MIIDQKARHILIEALESYMELIATQKISNRDGNDYHYCQALVDEFKDELINDLFEKFLEDKRNG